MGYNIINLSFIHWICNKNAINIFSFIINHIGILNIQKLLISIGKKSENSFMHYVFQECSYDIFALIIKNIKNISTIAQADIPSQNKRGNTCLHCVFLNRKMNIKQKGKVN